LPAATPAALDQPARRRSIVLLLAATALFWSALYVYVPILPVYAGLLGASLPMIGLLVGSYGIGQMLLRIPIGVWSDRLGRRRPFVAAGLAVAAISGVALALATEPVSLILARSLTGVAAAAWVAFTVLFASYYAPERATVAVSIISFVNIAAQAVATYGGSVLAQAAGWQAPFWGATGLGLLGLACLVGVRERPLVRSTPFTARDIVRVATRPALLVVAVAALLGTAINFATSFGFTPLYAAELGASRADLGALTAARLVPFALATLAAAWLAGRAGARPTIVSGLLALAVANLLVPLTRDLAGLAVLQALGGIGFGLSSPVLMALSIRAVPAQERATAMGAFQAIYSVGMLLGPWGAGLLADAAGLASVFIAAGGVALAAAALVAGAVHDR
jgi:MFS family permease